MTKCGESPVSQKFNGISTNCLTFRSGRWNAIRSDVAQQDLEQNNVNNLAYYAIWEWVHVCVCCVYVCVSVCVCCDVTLAIAGSIPARDKHLYKSYRCLSLSVRFCLRNMTVFGPPTQGKIVLEVVECEKKYGRIRSWDLTSVFLAKHCLSKRQMAQRYTTQRRTVSYNMYVYENNRQKLTLHVV